MARLRDRQKLFAQKYVETGFDRIQAIREAGYSERTGASIACRLLKKSQVRAEIDRIVNTIDEKCTVEAHEIIQSLRRIALAKPSAGINNSDIIRASEVLAKILGLMKDGLQINVDVAPAIQSQDELEALQMAGQVYVRRLVAARTIPAELTDGTSTEQAKGENNDFSV